MGSEDAAAAAPNTLRLPNDGHRYELVRGTLKRAAPQTRQQGVAAARIALSLFEHVAANQLGEVFSASTGFQLGPEHVRGCDVAFVRRDRILAAGEIGAFWLGAPDVAVEVVAPTDTHVEVEEKVMDWLAAGTQLVIVVNPAGRRVSCYRSNGEVRFCTEMDTLEAGELIPGWRLSAAQLFAS